MRVDYSALSRPFQPLEVTAFRKSDAYQTTPRQLDFSMLAILAAGFVVVLSVRIILVPNNFSTTSFVIFAGSLAFFGAFGFYILNNRSQKRTIKQLRLHSFCIENNLIYKNYIPTPTNPGLIFNIGDSRTSSDVIYSSQEPRYEIGNHAFVTSSGRRRQIHNWGYVCIELGRQVPHMILDARGDDVQIFGLELTDLPVRISKDQILSLEGDFNKYFTLYAPKEYERDALYIFTPDLMSLLVDELAQFDVEVVENKLYVYSKTGFNLLNQATMERLLRIINVVGSKTFDRTSHYADERVDIASIGSVALGGQRLKKGNLKTLTIIAVVFSSVTTVIYILVFYRLFF